MDQVVLPVVRVLAALAAVLALTTAVAAQDEHHAPARDLMIATIRNTAATSGIQEARNLSPAVLNALREVPRHQFVPEPLRDAFTMREIEGRSTEEAASLLAISPGNLAVRISRARARIGAALRALGWLPREGGAS